VSLTTISYRLAFNSDIADYNECLFTVVYSNYVYFMSFPLWFFYASES